MGAIGHPEQHAGAFQSSAPLILPSVGADDLVSGNRPLPRVFHVLTEAEPFSDRIGGAISRFAGNLLRGDHRARVVCPSADETWDFPSDNIFKIAPLRTYGRFSRRLISRAFIPFRLLALRAVLSPLLDVIQTGDVVVVHNRPEYVLAIQNGVKKRGAHLVLHMHNSHLRTTPAFLRRRLKADRFLFVSEFLRSELRDDAHISSRSAVLTVGADDQVFFPKSAEDASEPPVVLFVGRLVPEKGIHVLLDAMKLLAQRGVSAKARIVGSPKIGSSEASSYWNHLKSMSGPNVEFASYVSGPALAEEYRSAAVFCCPSVWDEPFGMVNLEAMATSLPVVATRAGGIPEIFREGGAVLVEKDSSVALADALQFVLENPAVQQELGRLGQANFRANFSWRAVRRRYEELLEGLGQDA